MSPSKPERERRAYLEFEVLSIRFFRTSGRRMLLFASLENGFPGGER